MSQEKKALHIRLFEAEDYPERLAALEKTSIRLMKAGFKDQARRVKEVYADFVEYVIANELDTLFLEGIDSPREAASSSSDRMQTKIRFRKLKRKKKKTKKKWLCATKPRLVKRRRSGERVWQSTVKYRNLKTRTIGVLNMMLGKDPTKKPKEVVIKPTKGAKGKGKKLRWCTGKLK